MTSQALGLKGLCVSHGVLGPEFDPVSLNPSPHADTDGDAGQETDEEDGKRA